MKRLAAFIVLALLVLIAPLFCTSFFDDSLLREQVRDGIEAIYDLDYTRAQQIFDQLKKDHPENPVGYGMTAIRAWHELLFASRNLAIYKYGIPTPFDNAESLPKQAIAKEEKEFLGRNKELQDFCDKLLRENSKNPLALYFKGVSYENLSTQDITLAGRWLRSVSHAKAAGKFHKRALKLDPDLIDAKTSTAVPEYVVPNLPVPYRWAALVWGIRGNKKGAVEKFQEVTEKGIYRATDAKVVLALLEAWKGDSQRAITLFSSLRSRYPRNFLYDISLAVAYEQAAKDPKAAIRIYQELLRDISSKAPGVQPGEIYLRIGKGYVTMHENSLALEQFQKAVQENQAEGETKPLAYYQMGLIYESRKDKGLAKDCYRQAVNYGGSMPLIEKEISQAKKKMK